MTIRLLSGYPIDDHSQLGSNRSFRETCCACSIVSVALSSERIVSQRSYHKRKRICNLPQIKGCLRSNCRPLSLHSEQLGGSGPGRGARASVMGEAAILSKQYRFILVSDLDWTMVRVRSLEAPPPPLAQTAAQETLSTQNKGSRSCADLLARPPSHLEGQKNGTHAALMSPSQAI